MPSDILRQRLRLLAVAGVATPAAMALVGYGLGLLAGKAPVLTLPPAGRSVVLGLAVAALTLTLVAVGSRVSPAVAEALKETSIRMGMEVLEVAGYPVMAVIVTAAGFGEEILFRGGLQPLIGLVPAALLFGFSHGGWRREMWVYAAAASVSGLLFGLVYQWTGDLWVPIIAHAAHNLASVSLLGKEIDISWEGGLPRIRLVEEEGLRSRVGRTEPGTMPVEGRTMQWETPFAMRPTARERGLVTGILPPGPHNDICDVPGVLVGHATIVRGVGPLVPGEGPVRTGVTAILPHGGNLFAEKVPAGVFVLNGFGKSVGIPQIQELGTIETPILLTNTLSTFRAADALVSWMIEQNPDIGINTGTVNPVVGECNDGFLNDIQGRHVTEEHVRAALESAGPGPVRQGAVGAGTGMVCFGFKGGIGSASRVVGPYTLGALVLANFGRREQLLIAGVPVGQRLLDYPGKPEPAQDEAPAGSVMVVLATDAPLDARQLTRLCKRGALGLARTGASAANGSGDFVIGFSTAYRIPHGKVEILTPPRLADGAPELDQLFVAAVEAVEEAVLNALFTAVTVTGRDGRVVPALPVDQVLAWVGGTATPGV
ncbi:MAG TPA: P1 family peptidase [Symbiobacteriaceae bacterium]